ncbi:MAG: regulatory protein RecX [Gammaproteobacteria bacterium]|nr:MAG: regulatory protein RecX [Gammaproteobacteria bacterium]
MEPDVLRKKALDLLARREHSALELEKKLLKGGAGREAVDELLTDLADNGWQSDQRFAEQYLQSRINKGWGSRKISAELEQRGVSERIIRECLLNSETDWVELARKVREKKFGHDLPQDWNEKSRQMRFLQQRGFDPEDIRTAMKEE